MSNLNEINQALKFYKNFNKGNICLLHCVSNYPCSNSSLNMRGMLLIKKFGYEIGFSDHTDNDVASILSIPMGCKVIEKHFTLDKKLAGPDHKASLNIKELKKFIFNIRLAEKSLGKKIKKCQAEEIDMKYDELYWLRLYMQIRLKEMELDISSHQVKHELREVEQRYFL